MSTCAATVVPELELARLHHAVVAEDVGLDLLGVGDAEEREAGACLGELPAVADLAA
jgi:hypothetical protein